MESSDAFGMLLFLCIFEIIGGAAVGFALRGLLQRDLSGCFFLIWGSGFGGIPLVIGGVSFLTSGQPTYFFAQLFVLLATIVTLALLPRDFMETRGDSGGAEGAALVGAVMTMVGGAVVLLTMKEGIGVPLLVGAIIAAFGIWLLLRTAIGVVRAL